MSKDNDFNNLLEKIYLKLDSINTLDEADLLEFKNKVREIDTTVLSQETVENFNRLSEKLNSLEEKNNDLNTSLSGLVETSTNILNKLSTKDEYSQAKLHEFLTELAFQIQTIKDSISTENNILSSDVISNVAALKENYDSINLHLENLNNIQNLALTNAEFEEYQKNTSVENLNAIKEQLSELHSNLSSQITILLDDIFKQESEGSFNEKIIAIKDKVESISENSIDQTNSIIKEIKDNFTDPKYIDCLNKIVIIYDSISRIDKWLFQFEDSIDINDISDKIDIVYENVSVMNEWASRLDNINKQVDELNSKFDKTTEANQIEEVLAKVDIIYDNISLMNDWAVRIDNVSTQINDIKGKLDDLSNDFTLITSSSKGDAKEYLYTLLDIESDFAKLHCIIDDSNKTADTELKAIKNQFELFQDDISSISKRTNKLIITSDNTNKVFKNHIDSLHSIIEDFDRKTVGYNPLEQTDILDKKLSTIKKLAMSSLQSDKVINEAFMHLAEWIDSAGATIEEIKDSFENAQAQLENVQMQNIEIVQKIEAASQSKTEQLENILSEMNERFIKQEEKIEALEARILENSKQEDDTDIKSVLDFIASQIIAANENAVNNKVLSQKMETMEHQLGKFEKNIARLVSYLDED